EQLLYEWNDTEVECLAEKCVHELFEEQVRKNPESTAVVCEGTSLSYGELNRRANQLAHYLRGLGLKPNSRIAICMERSLEIIEGLLGVLKAGCAYLPLDPEYPLERLRFMLKDSGSTVLLAQRHLRGLFTQASDSLRVIDLTDPSITSGM